MKFQSRSVVVLVLVGLPACKDNEKSFLSLSDALCERLSEDICAARELCCDGAPSAADCKQTEQAQCEVARKSFADDGDLSYDSARAARLQSEQTEELADCEPPLPLGRFFDGSLAEGAECERDTQCTSGHCDADTQTCLAPEVADLCPAP